jgi:hypothetical protein
MPAFAAEPETRPPISRFCRPLVEPQRWRQNLHSDLGMANMQREESKYEKLEREQREREQMRQAVAAYASPIIKCPPFRTNQPERQAPRPTALAATECRRPVAHGALRSSTRGPSPFLSEPTGVRRFCFGGRVYLGNR